MGLGTLPLTPPYTSFPSNSRVVQNFSNQRPNKSFQFSVSAKLEKEKPNANKKSLFSSVTEALDFAQVRSAEDAQLLEDAREATRAGEKMSREQVYIYIYIYKIFKIFPFIFTSMIIMLTGIFLLWYSMELSEGKLVGHTRISSNLTLKVL